MAGVGRSNIFWLWATGLIADESCPGDFRIEYYVLQSDFRRETHESTGVFQFSNGIPAFSSQAEAHIVYNWQPTEVAGSFPLRLCQNLITDADAVAKILGINLPDQDALPGEYANRFAHYPEWDYPLNHLPHTQRAGNFDFGLIPNWSQYWADRSKAKAIEIFGATRPNPGVGATQATRLMYCPVHHCYTIQNADGSGNPLNWQQWDPSSGEASAHYTGSYVVNQIYGGNGQDIPRSIQPYQCMTVIGIHFAPTAATIDQYQYGDFGHIKLAGSVDFQQKGCGGDDCGDPSSTMQPVPVDCECPGTDLGVLDGDTVAAGRPIGRWSGSEDYGYITDPSSGDYYTDETSVILENMLIGNKSLVAIEGAICSVRCEVKNLREAISYSLILRDFLPLLERIAAALEGFQFTLDTQPIVDKLEAIRSIHEVAFTLQMPSTE